MSSACSNSIHPLWHVHYPKVHHLSDITSPASSSPATSASSADHTTSCPQTIHAHEKQNDKQGKIFEFLSPQGYPNLRSQISNYIILGVSETQITSI